MDKTSDAAVWGTLLSFSSSLVVRRHAIVMLNIAVLKTLCGVEMIKSFWVRLRVLQQSKIVSIFLSLVLFLFQSSLVAAQQDGDSLTGYWKQKGESFYIKVDESEGGMNAEVVRNDWSPGLVGTSFFSKVVPVDGKKDRWVGEAPNPKSSKSGKATMRINREGYLSVRLRPGGRSMWVRSEAIEKRY